MEHPIIHSLRILVLHGVRMGFWIAAAIPHGR